MPLEKGAAALLPVERYTCSVPPPELASRSVRPSPAQSMASLPLGTDTELGAWPSQPAIQTAPLRYTSVHRSSFHATGKYPVSCTPVLKAAPSANVFPRDNSNLLVALLTSGKNKIATSSLPSPSKSIRRTALASLLLPSRVEMKSEAWYANVGVCENETDPPTVVLRR